MLKPREATAVPDKLQLTSGNIDQQLNLNAHEVSNNQTSTRKIIRSNITVLIQFNSVLCC